MYSAFRSGISQCFFAGVLGGGIHSLVCGMAARWKSGAWGQAKGLYDSVINGVLSMANGIDESCVILTVKAASQALTPKCGALNALVERGAGAPRRPCPRKILYGTVQFGDLPVIPGAGRFLERARSLCFLVFCPEDKARSDLGT